MGSRGQKSGAFNIQDIHAQAVAKIARERILINSIVSDVLRYEEFNGKRVRVVEKDGEITKGKCRVFIEGYDLDDDRDMVIGIKGILIDDIREIEIIE